ncbi:tRNA1(Val) (adenine(37)-N6)-methyltransferase [Sunxiuqinia elliptica]|nr:methyltransferase [Sunxiuqinia elliptica]
MGRNNYFQFKHFRIVQEHAAMKVGIDGVLLGAWINLSGVKRVLDIGTGTGLIALMAAQRSQALVDAVELEPEAIKDATANFHNSKWVSRIKLFQGAFQDFESAYRYDHLFSNPPFFENALKAKDPKRTQARHTDALSLQELLSKAKQLLNEKGRLSLILPVDQEKRLLELTEATGFKLSRIVRVAPDLNKKFHRLLVELSLEDALLQESVFYIRDAKSSDFSMDYRELTKDFYLAF